MCDVIFFSILVLRLFGDVGAAPESALFTSLPGFSGTFPSKHYSGYVRPVSLLRDSYSLAKDEDGVCFDRYVTVDGKPSPKNLFYYFVSSERNPLKDPLFTNGAGPFNFEAGNSKGTLPLLHLNPYSWSKVSSVIYLDSPAGVGFSYSENTSIYVNGDLQTASDTHFPNQGESYAGIYVPTLASNVAIGINTGVKPIINFKGYMVGNGVTDEKFDANAIVSFAHGMALISDSLFEEAEAACKGYYYGHKDKKCLNIAAEIDEALDGLNIYDILEPCFPGPAAKDDTRKNTSLPLSFKQLGVTDKPFPVRKRIFGRPWPFHVPVRDGIVPLWPELAKRTGISVPCMDETLATIWLNNEAVRKSIHASPETGEWTLCVYIEYTPDAGSMIKYHQNLTAQGYRALIFSGDHDLSVPYTGSQAWTRSLGYKVVDKWRPWQSNNQIAGYILTDILHSFTCQIFRIKKEKKSNLKGAKYVKLSWVHTRIR
ncbi:hypothetical protein RJ639_026213 [Escallonia herrerae]|uniref:Serine carboxypeptidase n=1 Tax=Escallonia herrerae TaxID=1293975 RepID=A0AA88RVH9_9ASTE|nr:hypothetical protein RJ639_026213 [Escallonia herrerae]